MMTSSIAPGQGSYPFLTSLACAANGLGGGGAAVEMLAHSPSIQEELIVSPLCGTKTSRVAGGHAVPLKADASAEDEVNQMFTLITDRLVRLDVIGFVSNT